MVLSYFASKDKAVSDSFSSKGSLLCQGMRIEEDVGAMRSSTLSKDLECFAITSKEGTSIRRMVLGCETWRERRRWCNALSAAASAFAKDDDDVRLMRISCRFRLGGVLLLRRSSGCKGKGDSAGEEDEDGGEDGGGDEESHNDVRDVMMKVVSYLEPARCILLPDWPACPRA